MKAKKNYKKGGKFPDLNKDGKVGVKKGMKGMKYEKGGMVKRGARKIGRAVK